MSPTDMTATMPLNKVRQFLGRSQLLIDIKCKLAVSNL
jgi:hypothetical protein